MAADTTIRINGKDYSIDDLTLDEVEALEEAFECSLEELDFRRAKVIKQVVFTMLRRDDPKVTLDDVGAIKLTSLVPPEPSTNGKRASAARR